MVLLYFKNNEAYGPTVASCQKIYLALMNKK